MKNFINPLNIDYCSEMKKRRKDTSESTEEDGAPDCKGERTFNLYFFLSESPNLNLSNYSIIHFVMWCDPARGRAG